MLESLGGLGGADIVDLFAGSGAMGLEALSRGARSATFVERDRSAVSCIRTNVVACGLEPAIVVTGDVVRFLRGTGSRRWDVAFCDPPYAFDGWPELLGALDAGVVVVESDREVEPPQGWEVHRRRRYGGTVVSLLLSVPPDPPAGRPDPE